MPRGLDRRRKADEKIWPHGVVSFMWIQVTLALR